MMLVYGQPGTGKSTFAISAADVYNTLVLNLAGNPQATRRNKYKKQLTVLDIESSSDFNSVYDFLRTGAKVDSQFAKTYGITETVQCVVVDQLTDLQRLSFAMALGETNRKPGDMGVQPERQHFGKALNFMVNFARLWFQLPQHVILCSQERSQTDAATGNVTYGVGLVGQSADEVASYAMLVGRTVSRGMLPTREVKIIEDNTHEVATHVMLLQGTGKYYAKDQYGMVDAKGKPVTYLVQPSVEQMLVYIGLESEGTGAPQLKPTNP